ncbi:urease subunit beta [Halopseudomonas pachastrellae]|nr:urease subunit beta [Halopseudomonas pachastrellae]
MAPTITLPRPILRCSFDRDAHAVSVSTSLLALAVRFEPGQSREVELVALAGERKVYGFRGDVMGSL